MLSGKYDNQRLANGRILTDDDFVDIALNRFQRLLKFIEALHHSIRIPQAILKHRNGGPNGRLCC